MMWVAPAAHADLPKVQNLGQALGWLERLQSARSVSTQGHWPLAAVLEHLAQSIEMSMEGYPEAHSPWFQHTAGAAAFAFFGWRERMSHPLDAPIPGAPPLALQADWRVAAQRLRAAVERFEAHEGALYPHFAYGPLDKRQYRLAHTLHIANHQDEIRVA
jgi:hypothetical protein